MSRARPHGFPHDTPDPLAASTSPIDALLDLVVVWIKVASACAALAGLLAFFFPSLLINLLR